MNRTYFSAIDVFDSCFTEEKVDIISDLVAANKVWFVQHVAVVLDSPLETIFPSAIILIVQIGPRTKYFN